MTSDRWEIPTDQYQEGIDVEPLRITTLHVERFNMDDERYTATYSGVRKYFVHEGVLYIETYDAEYMINSDRWIDLAAYTRNER